MSSSRSTGETSTSDGVRVAPANLASCEELSALFATRGPAHRCQCQRYRLAAGESFAGTPLRDRRDRLAEQTGCGSATASTSGLLAWLGEEPVGWCAVGPRRDLSGLVRVFTVPWKDREEDRSDPGVWAVTCVFVRVGHRRRGIGSALVAATVAHARAGGAAAVEGYPIITTDVITEELHVGTVAMFSDAGYHRVSAPTPRRVVMRYNLPEAPPG